MASDCNQNQFEIDTGSLCIICFKPSCVEGESALEVKQSVSKAFKSLLRYLGVHVYQLRQFWTGNLKGINQGGGMEVVDDFHKAQILVSLCEDCSRRTLKFMELFKQFDKIRLELDECTYDLVSSCRNEVEGDEGSHARKRRKVDGGKVEHDSGVAEMLRKEILQKCSSTINSSTPRVTLVDLKTTGLLRSNSLSKPGASDSNHNHHDTQEDSEVEGDDEEDAIQGRYHEVPLKVEISEKIQEVVSGAEFICTECGDCFTSSGTLNRHLVANHPAKVYEKRLPANASNDYVQEAVDSILKQQTPSSSNKRKQKYACPICFRGYQREGPLRLHIINKHVDEVTRNVDLNPVIHSKKISTPENKKRKSSSPRRSERKVVKAVNSNVLATCVNEDGKSSPDIEGDNLTSRQNSPCLDSSATRKPKKGLRRNRNDLQSRVLKFLGPAATAKSKEAVNCVHCGQRISCRSHLVKHLICIHPLIVIGDQLPPNTTELQLQTAIAEIIAQRRELRNGNGTRLRCGCHLCPINFEDASKLKDHTLSCHVDKVVEHVEKQMNAQLPGRNGKPFPCEHCPKGFARDGHHRTHMTVKHPIQIERIRDELPPGTSNHTVVAVVRSILKANHSEVAPDKLKYNCSFCSKEFRKASVFKKHLYSFHCDRLSAIILGDEELESGNGESAEDDDGNETKDGGIGSEPDVEGEESEIETMDVSEHDQSQDNADLDDSDGSVESGREEGANEGDLCDEGEDELEEEPPSKSANSNAINGAVEEEELDSEDEENSDEKMEEDGELEEDKQLKEVVSVASGSNAMESGGPESEEEEENSDDEMQESGQVEPQKEVMPVASGSGSPMGSGELEPTNDENETDRDSEDETEKDDEEVEEAEKDYEEVEEAEKEDDEAEEAENEDDEVEEAEKDDEVEKAEEDDEEVEEAEKEDDEAEAAENEDDEVEEAEKDDEVEDGELDEEEEEQPQNENISLFNGAKGSQETFIGGEENTNDGTEDSCDQQKSKTESNSFTFTSNCEIVMSNLI